MTEETNEQGADTEAEEERITWIRPSDKKITTNASAATIAYAKDNNWKSEKGAKK